MSNLTKNIVSVIDTSNPVSGLRIQTVTRTA